MEEFRSTEFGLGSGPHRLSRDPQSQSESLSRVLAESLPTLALGDEACPLAPTKEIHVRLLEKVKTQLQRSEPLP